LGVFKNRYHRIFLVGYFVDGGTVIGRAERLDVWLQRVVIARGDANHHPATNSYREFDPGKDYRGTNSDFAFLEVADLIDGAVSEALLSERLYCN
jgi:hypothetical protein